MVPKKFVALLLGGFPWKRTAIPQEALPFGEGTVLDRSVTAYREGGARDIVLALGPEDPLLSAALDPHREDLAVVRVGDEAAVLTSYLSAGIAALKEEGHAIAIGFTDMPLLTGDLIGKLFEAFRKSGKPIGVPLCQGILGHPLFLLPELRPRIEKLTPPATHRKLITGLPDDVEILDTEFAAVLRMIDEFSDYCDMLTVAGLQMPDLQAYRASLEPESAETESAQIAETPPPTEA